MDEAGLDKGERHWDKACFRTLVDHASDIITILDRDGRVLYESKAIHTVLGSPASERIGADPFDLIHADDVASVQTLFNEVVASPSSRSTARFRFRHKDGSWRWLEAVGTNLLADPDVGGVVITSRDITDRQRTEEQLTDGASVPEIDRESVWSDP